MRRAKSVVKHFLLMFALMAPLVGWALSQGVLWAVPCNKIPVNTDSQPACSSTWPNEMWCINRTKAQCTTSYGVASIGPAWPRECRQNQGNSWDHCVVVDYDCRPKMECIWNGLGCIVKGYVSPPAYFQQIRATSPSCVPGH